MTIETILTPAEFPALAQRDLTDSVCVVFDILRATSSFITALQNGAGKIIPVTEIEEALAWRQRLPEVLLAGERNGMRIRGDLAGGIDFDLGNSPREFRPDKVHGRSIVSTTTNGTRALRACARSRMVLPSSLLNLGSTARFVNRLDCDELLLVCAGTGESAALEDILAAGAFAGLVEGEHTDSTETAVRTYSSAKADLPAVLATSQNARRLSAIPDLRADVAFCGQRDVYKIVAAMDADGAIGVVQACG